MFKILKITLNISKQLSTKNMHTIIITKYENSITALQYIDATTSPHISTTPVTPYKIIYIYNTKNK